MARLAKATWKGPLANRYPGGVQHPLLGLVLHIMEGTLDGSDQWFHNPSSEASAHFGTGKDGRLWQWVDTDDGSWAQAAGNHTYVSIENEGHAGDQLTDGQLQACAEVLAWLNATEGVPLALADRPGDRGLIWHGAGGQAWGGHLACPGDPIIAQRPEILRRASALAGTQPPHPSSKGAVVVYPTPLAVGAHATKAVVVPPDGRGAYEVDVDGHIYAWVRPGTPELGNPQIGSMPAGHPYWGVRKVLDVQANGNGLSIIGTFDGVHPDGRYEFPA